MPHLHTHLQLSGITLANDARAAMIMTMATADAIDRNLSNSLANIISVNIAVVLTRTAFAKLYYLKLSFLSRTIYARSFNGLAVTKEHDKIL
jgi:hypothetical protein